MGTASQSWILSDDMGFIRVPNQRPWRTKLPASKFAQSGRSSVREFMITLMRYFKDLEEATMGLRFI
jgi:hypothetical protein